MTDQDRAPSTNRQYNAQLGMKLFVVYLLFYLGFVLINAFAAGLMDTIVFMGLNLAIVYGFGLIVVAFVLAMVYGMMCRRDDDQPQNAQPQNAQPQNAQPQNAQGDVGGGDES